MVAMRIRKVECNFFGEWSLSSNRWETTAALQNQLGGSDRAIDLMTGSTRRPFSCGAYLGFCIVWLFDLQFGWILLEYLIDGLC